MSAAPLPMGPVGVLGLGCVGRFLALSLAERGVEVHGWDVIDGPAAADVRAAGVPVALGALPAGLAAWPLLLLPVADRAIAGVARDLGRHPLVPGAVVLHTSGFHPADVLRPHLPPHVAVGSLHPVHAFADAGVPDPRGIPAGLEGEARAVATARRLADLLGLSPFAIAPGQKTLYHAALALLSNGTVGLFASAQALLAHAGVPEAEAHPLLARLLASTTANLADLAPSRALTGPVRRGDADVVQAHLAAVAREVPTEQALVRAVVGRLERLVAEECP